MQARGVVAVASFGAEPDIAAWADECALNPSRLPPSRRDDPRVQAARSRLATVAARGAACLAELGQASASPMV
jgi:hypothetical protein